MAEEMGVDRGGCYEKQHGDLFTIKIDGIYYIKIMYMRHGEEGSYYEHDKYVPIYGPKLTAAVNSQVHQDNWSSFIYAEYPLQFAALLDMANLLSPGIIEELEPYIFQNV